MKQVIREIAEKNSIDEIRFIDAAALTAEHVGDTSLFTGRQPREIMPEANSIIVVSIYIGAFTAPAGSSYGRMSRLALSGLYSNIVEPLIPVKHHLEEQGFCALIVDGAADETSIPIKGAAVKAGLGWIGKNTLLLNERYGSFQALGAILTDAVLNEDYELSPNRCGTCTKCVESCPSAAIQTPRKLTRSRCLSHILDGGEGEVPLCSVDLQGYFFECDICQNACPWNQSHIRQPLKTGYGALYDPDAVERQLRIERLEAMDEETYDKELTPWMGAEPIAYDVFIRNLSMVRHRKK